MNTASTITVPSAKVPRLTKIDARLWALSPTLYGPEGNHPVAQSRASGKPAQLEPVF